MKRFLGCLILMVAVLGLSRQASAATIMQFQQVDPFGQPWTVTAVGGVTTITATNLLVQANLNPLFCLAPGCGGLPLVGGQYTLNFSASSTGPAALINAGADISQPFAGTMSFTGTGAFAGVNLLTFSFSDQLSGGVGSGNATLSAGDPPDLFFNASSAIFDPLDLLAPRGFSIGFSDWQGGLQRTGAPFTVASSLADAAGTLNATPAVVPEPASMLLLGSGLLGLAARVRSRRLRKA